MESDLAALASKMKQEVQVFIKLARAQLNYELGNKLDRNIGRLSIIAQ